eukprot:1597691-Amphidinium_carterae.6
MARFVQLCPRSSFDAFGSDMCAPWPTYMGSLGLRTLCSVELAFTVVDQVVVPSCCLNLATGENGHPGAFQGPSSLDAVGLALVSALPH